MISFAFLELQEIKINPVCVGAEHEVREEARPLDSAFCVCSRGKTNSQQQFPAQPYTEGKRKKGIFPPPKMLFDMRIRPGRVWTRDHRSANDLVFNSVTHWHTPQLSPHKHLLQAGDHKAVSSRDPSAQERTVVYTRLRIPNTPNKFNASCKQTQISSAKATESLPELCSEWCPQEWRSGRLTVIPFCPNDSQENWLEGAQNSVHLEGTDRSPQLWAPPHL